MIFLCNIDFVVALMFVTPTGHAEEFSPIINFGSSVGMHGTMNDHGIGACMMRSSHAADVLRVAGICKALVVNDNVNVQVLNYIAIVILC